MQYPCIGRGAGSNAYYLIDHQKNGICLEYKQYRKPGDHGDTFKTPLLSINEFLSSEDLTSEIFKNLLKYWEKVL